MLNVLDLFSGIGGMSLGLESTGGFRTVAFCEIEPFPRAVLAYHWPGVPIHDDVQSLSASSLRERVDVIAGGFPCQDISVAGKGAGIDGARSGLWAEMFRLVCELRPAWVLAENVGALRTRGGDRVLADLESAGYTVRPLVVGAWAVGAPHKRERVWIVAHRDETGRGAERGGGVLDGERAHEGYGGLAGSRLGCDGPRWPARPGEPQHEWEEPRLAYTADGGRAVRPAAAEEDGQADAQRDSGLVPGRPQGPRLGAGVGHPDEPRADALAAPGGSRPAACEPGGGVGLADSASESRGRAGQPREGTDPGRPQQPLGGSAHGLPERLVRRANRDALKAYGNSVVPQVVAAIGRAILEAEGVTP